MSHETTTPAANIDINETLALLDTEYKLDQTLRKNIVLFIGITGSGKSTICQFLSGNQNLRAVKVGDTSDYYITDGNDKVSKFTTKSKTLLPELVPVPNADTVLADCPGFSDTRSAKHDIAAAVFTKKLLDESERVKFVVTTAHHTVRTGVDRVGFTDLLSHVVHFIKDVDKYKDSIGLLVTKVENNFEENEDGDYIPIPDSVIVNQIGSFLSEIKNELLHKPPSSCISKQIQFIDNLKVRDDKNKYSKIAIFRRPSKNGNLHTNQRLSKNKSDIGAVINSGLQYSPTTHHQFGLSLSADTMNFLFQIRESINTTLSKILDEYIRIYSQRLIGSKTDNIEGIKAAISRSLCIVDLLNEENVTNIANLMEQIQILDPKHPTKQFAEWVKQHKYMQFLETISPTAQDTTDYSKYRMRLGAFKDQIAVNVKLLEHNAENIIDQAIANVIADIITTLKNEAVNQVSTSHSSSLILSNQIKSVHNSWQLFIANNQNSRNLSFEEFLENFNSNFTLSASHVQKLESLLADIEVFKATNSTFNDGNQVKWMRGFIGPLNELASVIEWYAFITGSYEKLIASDTQNVQFSKNWNQFKNQRKQFGTDDITDRILENRLRLSANEQMDLNNLIDSLQLLCLSSYEHSFESTKLVVKDSFVRLSKVTAELFPTCSLFSELYIFATDTVLIDISLVEPGKNVYIIAPLWKIEGSQVINLRGLDATSQDQNGFSMAGSPGQPGGNFIGIGDKFINGNNLTIDVSGGNGSNGRNGDNGVNGQDGLTPPVPEESEWRPDRSDNVFSSQIEKVQVAGFKNVNGNTYKMFGTEGTPGSRGGDGGKPGYGAKHGCIFVNSTKINKLAYLGKNGAEGKGGKGGTGGAHGMTRYIQARCEHSFFKVKFFYDNRWQESHGHAENGDDGTPGIVGNPVVAALPQSFLPKSTLVDQYKQYVQQKESLFVDSLEFINRFDLMDS